MRRGLAADFQNEVRSHALMPESQPISLARTGIHTFVPAAILSSYTLRASTVAAPSDRRRANSSPALRPPKLLERPGGKMLPGP